MYVLGGVGCNGVIPHEDEILICDLEGAALQVSERIIISTTGENTKVPRPLIVGSSIAYLQHGEVVILGGGATCFSMGTFCMWLLTPLHGKACTPRPMRILSND